MLSWNLNKKEAVGTVLVAFFCICMLNVVYFYCVPSCMVCVIGYASNKVLRKKIRLANKNIIDFMNDSRRNFDNLILGDTRLALVEDSSKSLYFVIEAELYLHPICILFTILAIYEMMVRVRFMSIHPKVMKIVCMCPYLIYLLIIGW